MRSVVVKCPIPRVILTRGPGGGHSFVIVSKGRELLALTKFVSGRGCGC